jgi:cation diffusion facilitator CzcD-associated flavoprotein CzcO
LSGDLLDWLVIGGGIHGVHLAARLIGEARVPPERLRIVDPGSALLDTWRRCVANTGMQHLRSPGVHHLDLEPFSLLRFGGAMGRGRKAERGSFAAPYDRPSVRVFDAHCDEVIARYDLDALHVRDVATDLQLGCDGVTVGLREFGSLQARRVLLALGASHQPRWPVWARAARAAGARVHHVFEPGFRLDPDALPDRIAVVGGGITAAQVALRLVRPGRRVHILSRHALRQHQFDSDPGWVGPKNMHAFSATPDPDARRRMIVAARHTGSLPPDVHRALRRALQRGDVSWHDGEAHGVFDGPEVKLHAGDARLRVEAVLLATGFEARRPGGELVDQLVATHLPCSTCGYPLVDPHLRWHPRVFVTGPLAELQIGPASRNIVGARRAAERIVPVARVP